MADFPRSPEAESGGTFRLVRASQYSMEVLTAAYNQARADYLVPMSMTTERLEAYCRLYNVDLDWSWAAVDGDVILGLAMLGVRPSHTWVTRLGVVPEGRRRGTGAALLQALLDGTRALNRRRSLLEVIQGNEPAQRMFLKAGFRPLRGLSVLRRAAAAPAKEARGHARWLDADLALERLPHLVQRPAWTNEIETYQNGGGTQGLEVDLSADGQGWLIFRQQSDLLSHFQFQTESGSPAATTAALLAHLFARYPLLDSFVENISLDDPHLPAMLQAGFSEDFRRTEMQWEG